MPSHQTSSSIAESFQGIMAFYLSKMEVFSFRTQRARQGPLSMGSGSRRQGVKALRIKSLKGMSFGLVKISKSVEVMIVAQCCDYNQRGTHFKDSVGYKAVITTVHISEAPPTSQDQSTKPHRLAIPESSKASFPLSPALTLTATGHNPPRQDSTGRDSVRRTDLPQTDDDLDAQVEKELSEIWKDLRPSETHDSFDRLRTALSMATTLQKQRATYVAVSLASEHVVPRGLEAIAPPIVGESTEVAQQDTNVQPFTS